MTEDRLAELMVKVVDGVATPAEREELMAVVTRSPELTAELSAQRAVKAATDGWTRRLEADLRADRRERDGPNWLAGLGVTLLLVSLVVLVSGAVAEVWLDDAPVWVKLGFGGGAASVAVLVTWAVWSRLRRGKDPYEEVVR
jgi:hypothetical protein